MRDKYALTRRSPSRLLAPPAAALKEGVVPSSNLEHDRAYFQAYSHVGIHEEMIKDRARTDAYRDAIFYHSDFIRDKVVMDVGCGTGILSIFCAFAGARKVYAVDASDIAVQAKEVVKTNHLSDVITVLHGRVEDLQIDEEVDVIVSEWMGYMLLYESMLGSVIYARDRWLKTGGLMLPSFATLYMAPVTNAEKYSECIDFWRSVYGIDMSAMLPLAKQHSFEEPCVETIAAESVLSWPIVIKEINCNTITIGELETVKADFCVSSIMTASLHGFALWFDVSFGTRIVQATDLKSEFSLDSSLSGDHDSVGISRSMKRAKPSGCVILSTAPDSTPTHWAQVRMYSIVRLSYQDRLDVEGVIEQIFPKNHTHIVLLRVALYVLMLIFSFLEAEFSFLLLELQLGESSHCWLLQTLLYVYDPIEVKQDQEISGSIELSQSKENLRFLNVFLKYRSGTRDCVKESVMR